MSALVQLSTHRDAASGKHYVRTMPVVVISPHNQCNCRCVMCDIWRIRENREISSADLAPHLAAFRKLHVRWVVLSGGEPQMHSHLHIFLRAIRAQQVRVTLLTAGLLLERQAEIIADTVDDVIVSFDGPPEVHDRIRRVKHASATIAAGITALRRYRKNMTIRARCTVQKANHNRLCDAVEAAHLVGMNSISFLAADVSSSAFNRPDGWKEDRRQQVLLDHSELEALEQQIERLIQEEGHYAPGFIVESPDKLRRIPSHFRAWLEGSGHVAPKCNAPWVSAVIEASGDVRPCFFHPTIGNIHDHSFDHIVNGPEALRFREQLDVSQNSTCRKCVCSLYLPDADHI